MIRESKRKGGPKVTVIGAGSLFFGRQALWSMLNSSVLKNGTLTYVDTDKNKLDKICKLAKLLVSHTKSNLKVECFTDYKEALPNSDFVVLSFSNKNVAYRRIDCEISLKYGIRMCSGDTIGPGGIFRSMRELPTILEIARDVEKICPDAWLINYINPTAVNGMALQKYVPNVKSFALCDILHMPKAKRYRMVQAGIIPDTSSSSPELEKDFELNIGGVNHFTWIFSAKYKGVDVLPEIRKYIERKAKSEKDEGYAKYKFNHSYSLILWDLYGLCPACISHTKEYVPFWQGEDVLNSGLPPLSIFDTDERQSWHEEMWEEIDSYISGGKSPDVFMKKYGPDHATDIIETMWGGLNKQFYINTKNNGAITNLDKDSFVEVLCDLDVGTGPTPVKSIGRFPNKLLALQKQILKVHELTADAIVHCDKEMLIKAMEMDPLIKSHSDAVNITKELLKAEQEDLPICW